MSRRFDTATCLDCDATHDVATAEAQGWQRGPCTCAEPCPTGAVWLCPEHRVDNASAKGAEVAA